MDDSKLACVAYTLGFYHHEEIETLLLKLTIHESLQLLISYKES
jgi:hypothetical protein